MGTTAALVVLDRSLSTSIAKYKEVVQWGTFWLEIAISLDKPTSGHPHRLGNTIGAHERI